MLTQIQNDSSIDPLSTSYALDINETRMATFSAISGGEMEIIPVKHNVVYLTGELKTLMIPGATRFSPVVLDKGYGNTKELYNWFVLANSGQVFTARKNVSIVLNAHLEDGFKPLVGWNLYNAWPTKISGFESDQSLAPKLAKFSITLVCEGIERYDP
jgi:phage tail-like protein